MNTIVPKARYSHSGTQVGNELVIVGGKCIEGGPLEIYWYNTDLGEWWQPTLQGTVSCNRYAHSSIYYNGKIIVFGGFNGLFTFNDIHCIEIDPNRSSRTVRLPEPQLGFDLKSLVNNSMFSDVIFQVEQQPIYGHRNILAARCTYFRSMFLSKLRESQQLEITIPEISYKTFLSFINYVYTESLEIDVEQAVDLLMIANLYQFDKLTLALSYLLEHYMDIDNCCRLYVHSDHYQAPELKQIALQFIVTNYHIVKSTPGYAELTEEQIKIIVSKKL